MPTSSTAQTNSQSKKQNTASKAKAKAPKQGGNMVQDIQRLAVPFSLLLAKKGLDMAVEKNKAPAPAAAPKKDTKAPKAGGASRKKSLRNEMDDLSNEIERYLRKY